MFVIFLRSMPAIYLFHRRTFFGGDDLQPATFFALLLRLAQLTCFLGPVFAKIAHLARSSSVNWLNYLLYDENTQDDSCRHSHMFAILLLAHAIASAIYSLASAYLEWRLHYWASQGSPTETQPRASKVAHLMEIKLVPYSLVLFTILGLGLCVVSFAPTFYRCSKEDPVEYYIFYKNSINNESLTEEDGTSSTIAQREIFQDLRFWWIAFALLLISQLCEIVVSWVYLLHLCREPRAPNHFVSGQQLLQNHPNNGRMMIHHEDVLIDREAERHELMEAMWAERCASMCQCLGVASCFMFGGREVIGQGDFGEVARALADYLETRGVLDVVPSDIAAGFLVLRSVQKSRIHRSRQEVVQEVRRQSQPARLEQGETNATPSASFVEEPPPANAMAIRHLPDSESDSDYFTCRSSNTSSGDQLLGDQLLLPLGEDIATPDPSTTPIIDRRSVFRVQPGGHYERETRCILMRQNAIDMAALEEGARYAKYALAIYTWVLYLYVHPVTGISRLATKGCCACVSRKRRRSDNGLAPPHFGDEFMASNGRIEGDNMCQAHKNALLLTAGLEEADLVYAQLKSGFRDNPYCILLDHEWKSVVVSIRGTFSLEDCVTDVLIEPESVGQLGVDFGFDADDQYCHGGMLIWVRNIHRDLQRHQLLEKLLLGPNALYPDYCLRLVGHSLGAATCTLLSYMLRQRFPNLRCVNYSPPGCSVSWDLAVGCKDWCSTFVLDSDIVPRLSLDSMELWRDEILELIGRIKVPKVEVARRFLKVSDGNSCGVCFDPPIDNPDNEIDDMDDILYGEGEAPETEYSRQLERFQRIQEERRRSRGEARSVKLFPPGKMIHLVKTGEKRGCIPGIARALTCCTTNFGFDYTPVWINNDDLDEIVISPQMGTDHFPNRMLNVLDDVSKDYGLSRASSG